jgi:hypothetical protein
LVLLAELCRAMYFSSLAAVELVQMDQAAAVLAV